MPLAAQSRRKPTEDPQGQGGDEDLRGVEKAIENFWPVLAGNGLDSGGCLH